ncbi:MAG: hypothetical protein ACFB0G_23125 [Leptolyngbyaceae cyanobacterium]
MSTAATQNGHFALPTSWSTLSVRDFFEQVSWTGATPPPAHQAEATTDLPTLSFQLKVSEFFSHFPWEGQPDIGTPVAPLTIQPELPAEDDLTLDGFADLF